MTNSVYITDELLKRIVELRAKRRELDSELKEKVNEVKAFMRSQNKRRYESQDHVVEIEKKGQLRANYTKLQEILSKDQYEEVTYKTEIDYCYINKKVERKLVDGKFVKKET
jgi:hypothetical protein